MEHTQCPSGSEQGTEIRVTVTVICEEDHAAQVAQLSTSNRGRNHSEHWCSHPSGSTELIIEPQRHDLLR